VKDFDKFLKALEGSNNICKDTLADITKAAVAAGYVKQPVPSDGFIPGHVYYWWDYSRYLLVLDDDKYTYLFRGMPSYLGSVLPINNLIREQHNDCGTVFKFFDTNVKQGAFPCTK